MGLSWAGLPSQNTHQGIPHRPVASKAVYIGMAGCPNGSSADQHSHGAAGQAMPQTGAGFKKAPYETTEHIFFV